MRKTRFSLFLFALCMTFSGFVFAEDAEVRYDEVFEPNGQIREHYAPVMARWANLVQKIQDYAKQTYNEFKRGKQDSNSVGDLPRIITQAEYDVVTRGVHQRERAIQAFLHDHYSGKKNYAKDGIISAELVNAIIARSGEDGYKNYINGKTPLNFHYGPDLIRGPDGKLRALEDNIGNVGGFGDIILAQEMVEKRFPELAANFDYPRATSFYDQLLKKYEQQAKKFGGKVVFYADHQNTDDSEESRTIEIFEKLGVEVITPTSQRRLAFEKGGVFAQDANGANRQKVGFVALGMEHSDADLTHPASLEMAILTAAGAFVADKKAREPKALRRQVIEALMAFNPLVNKEKQLNHIKHLLKDTAYRVNRNEGSRRANGLIDAILQGRVGSSYSPGAEFVGDKQMYTYMEKFIEYYLKEVAIIKNVETYMFVEPGTNKVSEQVMDMVFGKDRKGANFGDWVIKPVDGRGGDGIIFGKETKPEQIPEVIQKILNYPYTLQVQRNTPPSLIPGNRIIDTRALTYSTKEQGIVSPVPWSRSATLDKSRLINVSAGGAVLGVFVVTKKGAGAPTCHSVFAGLN